MSLNKTGSKRESKFSRILNELRKGWLLILLETGGIGALLYYFSWWFADKHLASPWLVLMFIFAVLYGGVQILGNWTLYFLAREPEPAPHPAQGMTVDVFVTAFHEPYDMIELSLAAACVMRGDHRTWLLDDGSDPALAALAERLKVGYLTRDNRVDAKAGNLNAALPRTEGEIIAIFDVDHVPSPDFLEKSLGYFNQPEIGFVQVMLTFANSRESWVAQAAMETSLEFYNPTSLGSNVIGGATMMGSNALIRRKALDSIGGYRPGLAEDLATSVALHAAGWRSAYVAEPLAPGLAPPSFTAWFVQQLKWARGVFELLLTAYPRAFPKLTWGQRLSYAVRMTKYWVGPVVGLHLFATIAVLIFGQAPLWLAFHEYLLYLTPLVVFDVLIRSTALQIWKHPSTPSTSLARAVILVYATWPIYMIAWFMALLRVPLKFQPTPKTPSGKLNPLWLMPQILAVVFLTAGMLYTVLVSGHQPSVLVIFAILQGLLQLALLTQWLYTEIKTSTGLPKFLVALRSNTRPLGIIRKEINGHIRTYLTDLPFTIDPIPLDVVDKVITILNKAHLEKRQVFIHSDAVGDFVAGQFVTDLAKETQDPAWPLFRVRHAAKDRSGQPENDKITNDLEISIDQMADIVQPGDVFLCISSNGGYAEIFETLQLAKKAQAQTIALSGLEGWRLDHYFEVNLRVPGESNEHIGDAFLILEHLICKALRELNLEIGAGEEDKSVDETGEIHPEDFPVMPGFEAGPVEFSYADRAGSSQELLYALLRDVEAVDSWDYLLERVLRTSLEVIGAESGSIVLFNEAGIASEAAIAYNGEIEVRSAQELIDTLQDGLGGWVVAQRRPALVKNTHDDPRWLRRIWEENRDARSALSVPLMDRERLVGVLTLVHSKAGRFTEVDLVLLVAVSVSFSFISTKRPNKRAEAL